MTRNLPAACASGVLYIHSSPPALCPHIEWAVAAELGVRVSLRWTAQPSALGNLRTEFTWYGRTGAAGRLAAALRGWAPLRYEVTEDPGPGQDGERYSVTPSLGVFRATTSTNGDILVAEGRLRALQDTTGSAQFAHGLDLLLGSAWDAELEPYRAAGDGAPVSLLHQVV